MRLIQAEHEIQAAILQWLELHGINVWRVNNMSGKLEHGGYVKSYMKGVADISGICSVWRKIQHGCDLYIDGIRLEIEVKRPGKKPSKEQEKFLEMINDSGGIAIWVDGIEALADKLPNAGVVCRIG